MEEKILKSEELAGNESKSNRYDYFSICHHFVNKIKILNELQNVGKIKHPGFS